VPLKNGTISNALDGSEDDIVWQDQTDNKRRNYNDEDEDDNIPLSALRDIYRIFQEENQEEFDGF
jgi:hypothetical protein